ncbi:hypothetical protein NG831_19920 [Xanthomonas sacchari]|uniref:hypothetical protein n=1 Tax=Xanthomonas sacchari TaxID=56458 RepID=UPI00225A3A49|nr:hypothetical protein [Xanthomonas sacchari]UYK66355.1 hypothetical protein NG831_19920 [Xanthomonas sacchari]
MHIALIGAASAATPEIHQATKRRIIAAKRTSNAERDASPLWEGLQPRRDIV